MSHDDVEPIELYPGNLRHPLADIKPIGVAVDRGDGGQRLELGQQIERADITRMEDVVHLGKGVEDLGPKESVGIGDDAQAHLVLTQG
jgi:hypothetical protein